MEDIFSWVIVLFFGLFFLWVFLPAIIGIFKEPCDKKTNLANIEELSEQLSSEKIKNEQLTQQVGSLEKKLELLKQDFEIRANELEHEKRLLKIEQANAAAKNNELFWEQQKFRKEKDKAIKEAKEEIACQFAFHPELVATFLEGIDKPKYYESIMQSVLQHAFDKPPAVLKVDIYARIHSTSSDRIYRTTLKECSCPDHGNRNRPCKHMLYLTYLLGLLQIDQKAQREATEIYNDLGVEIAELRESISKEREKHKKLQAVNIEVQNAINEAPNAYPRIAGLMADLVALQFKESEIYLRSKTPPAHKSADEVARMREKVRAIEKRNVEWDEKLETLRNWFPNIDDVFDKDFKPDMWELETREPTAKEIKDYISKHINTIKYNNLK